MVGRKREGDPFVCVVCFVDSSSCEGLRCSRSRCVLNPKLVQTSRPEKTCHVCRSPAAHSCVYCDKRDFCLKHYEGVCLHCQDKHCSVCEDLWTLRLPGFEPIIDWTVQEHLQLTVVLDGLRSQVLTKEMLGIPSNSAQCISDRRSQLAVSGDVAVRQEVAVSDQLAVSEIVAVCSTLEKRIMEIYRLPRPVPECMNYLHLADEKIRQERRVYLSYPIRRIVYSKLDRRPIYMWPSSAELLVRSVYPRLHYRYSLPGTLEKVTSEFAKLLEYETLQAMKECLLHRHRLFDLTPGAYDFNSFELSLVEDGKIHSRLAKLWYMCKYRKNYIRGSRCSVPRAHTFRKPKGGAVKKNKSRPLWPKPSTEGIDPDSLSNIEILLKPPSTPIVEVTNVIERLDAVRESGEELFILTINTAFETERSRLVQSVRDSLKTQFPSFAQIEDATDPVTQRLRVRILPVQSISNGLTQIIRRIFKLEKSRGETERIFISVAVKEFKIAADLYLKRLDEVLKQGAQCETASLLSSLVEERPLKSPISPVLNIRVGTKAGETYPRVGTQVWQMEKRRDTVEINERDAIIFLTRAILQAGNAELREHLAIRHVGVERIINALSLLEKDKESKTPGQTPSIPLTKFNMDLPRILRKRLLDRSEIELDIHPPAEQGGEAIVWVDAITKVEQEQIKKIDNYYAEEKRLMLREQITEMTTIVCDHAKYIAK